MGIEWTNEKIEEARKLIGSFYRKFRCEGFDSWDDFCQDCLIQMLKSGNSYDESRGTFGFWCYLICRNVSHVKYMHAHKDFLTNKKSVSLQEPFKTEDGSVVTYSDFIASDDDTVEDSILAISLMDSIKNHYMNNPRLSYIMDQTISGMDSRDIAKELGISRQRVDQIIQNERRRLSKMLNYTFTPCRKTGYNIIKKNTSEESQA